jgi:hypothetical protein
MLPFGVPDLEQVQPVARLASWMSCMRQSPHVSFGDPTLEPRFGLVLDGATVKDSMAALACKADKPDNRNCEEKRHGAEHTINPRVFLDGTVNSVTSSQFAQQRGVSGQVRGSAVFFGGSWDDTDHYMTPAGMVNGVEVHAAAFTSIGNHARENKWLAFVADLILGLAFGFITGWLWGQYFDCRLSEGVRQQLGWFYIMLLIIGFIFIIAIAFRLSYELLARWQIWASPVPVAIGRFIEGFVTGSVAQAVEAALKGRHQGIAEPRGLYDRMRRSAAQIVELWKKVENPGPESAGQNRGLLLKPTWVRAHRNQLALALGKWKYRAAAIVLVLGPLLWCLVVIACLVSLFEGEDFE